MNKLKMKAKSGFTLVELLVVMLILTILAVGMLPVFKEYICKSQYAAEAVPVIGNLRTKISLFQYEHNKLPGNSSGDDYVSSWEFDGSDKEKYVIADYALGQAPGQLADMENSTDASKLDNTKKNDRSATDFADPTNASLIHFGHASVLDVDYQDLKGRRSRPIDYVYYKIKCAQSTDSAYVIGCFGSGHGGLAEGTGYAVCEINLVSQGKKYIGTFERYKAKEKGQGVTCPYLYLSDADGAKNVNGDSVYCPKEIDDNLATAVGSGDDRPTIIQTMQLAGWKFND